MKKSNKTKNIKNIKLEMRSNFLFMYKNDEKFPYSINFHF